MEYNERKITKKIGSCKCNQYKREIEDLNVIIDELKLENQNLKTASLTNSPALTFTKTINENFSFSELPNSFSEFNSQMENEKNSFSKEDWEEPEEFDVTEFNRRFEAQSFEKRQQSFEKQQQSFKKQQDPFRQESVRPQQQEELSDLNLNYKTDYNPNILPPKVITGFEEFDNDAFNKEFEKQLDVNVMPFGFF
jgi:hypothetical protein